MNNAINVEVFRKHYEDITSCRDALNVNADKLNSSEENAIEALIPIMNDYGREMMKKLVVNAVLQNSKNYNEQVRKWADNAVISRFIFETDNVLSDYIPDQLSEAALERIAMDIMEKEKNKQTITSVQGTEYEVLQHNAYRSLLSLTNPDNMVIYCHCPYDADEVEKGYIDFSDNSVRDLAVYYTQTLAAYKAASLADERSAKVRGILTEQYNDFKAKMLNNPPEDIYEACYKVAAVEDVYFHLTENLTLTEAQENYIIKSAANGDNMLMDMAMDWYENGDYSNELSEHITEIWYEKELNNELFDDDEEELE